MQTINLENSIVYDIETFPNCFTLHLAALTGDFTDTFEISEFKDERERLIQLFNWLQQTQTPMIGFNNVGFDYPVIHHLYRNPHIPVVDIYGKAQAIIDANPNDKFGHLIWESDRFAPQIDLFKINHFDNKAKSTGLKGLQINMRSPSVVDMPVEVGTALTREQIDNYLIPYNKHDVEETKKFALHNIEAMNFRISLIPQFGLDVMNWSDTKIGTSMMESKLGDALCYDRSSGRKVRRQTPRGRIAINDIIFPYIHFRHPEFNRVLGYLRNQVLTAQDLQEFASETGIIQTKGVFTGLKATVNGFDFHFGTGGIHGSIEKTRVVATDEWLIRDIDVAALYPSIAIKNTLFPEHLGERFVQVYAELPEERKRWQKEKGKKCVEANTIKLAQNGVYGNSNNAYSVFYDPKYTMSITINGQLMLCMLAENLMDVPTLRIIQINTDGVTYFIHRDFESSAAAVCREWEVLTRLVLEDANYKRMFIRDVNNYIAEGVDGSLKIKGAYWSPDPLNYADSISNAQPPAWHKDLGNVVSIRAAVAAMVHGVDPEAFIRACTNPYDFMCKIKVRRTDVLYWGATEVQRNTRYYVSTDGQEMVKVSPPTGQIGSFKKANGISDAEYHRVMQETGGQWDERVCTKNKSQHVERRTGVESGFKVTVCNDVEAFDFSTVNYDYYINEARKLII